MKWSLLLSASLLPVIAMLQDPPAKEEPRAVVGAACPEFRLNDHEGKLASRAKSGGRWTLMAFYPKAATPG